MRSRPAQLQVADVRQEDEAEYRCRVDFKRGRTVNTIISLRVVVPPSELSIYSAQDSRQQTRLEGLIGPFNEDEQLQLVCVASGGKPRPQIVWRRDFQVIESTYQNADKDGSYTLSVVHRYAVRQSSTLTQAYDAATSVVLKIPSLGKSHLLSIFTCQASNTNLTSALQSSITLDLNRKFASLELREQTNKSSEQSRNRTADSNRRTHTHTQSSRRRFPFASSANSWSRFWLARLQRSSARRKARGRKRLFTGSFRERATTRL